MKIKNEPYKISAIAQTQRQRVVVLLFTALSIFFTVPLSGQETQTNDDMKNPPYLARTSNFMAVMFSLDADQAQTLLPSDVKVQRDENGMATAAMEIYTTDQISGVPNYSIAFISLVVSDEETNYNTPGNWSVWGKMSNTETLKNFKHFYNFPYQLDQNITIEKKDDKQIATIGTKEGEGLVVSLTKNEDLPVSAEGLATIFSRSTDGKVLKTQIPWVAEGNQATVDSVIFTNGDNKVLEVLQHAKPVYGQISSNAFSYTLPLTK